MEYLITMDDGTEAIVHYGVIGMKWGIRHDPERTAQKVAAQVSKDRAKALAYRTKAQRKDTTLTGKSKTAKQARYQAKAYKYAKKANRSDWHPLQSSHRRAVNQAKAQKYQNKANGYSNSVAKVAKYNQKASKYQLKADRLEAAYAKQLSKLNRRNIKQGKDLVDRIS